MTNTFDYRCPKCGASDRLDIQARVWVRLTEWGSGDDASHDGSHEWDGDSPYVCNACQAEGMVAELAETEAA